MQRANGQWIGISSALVLVLAGAAYAQSQPAAPLPPPPSAPEVSLPKTPALPELPNPPMAIPAAPAGATPAPAALPLPPSAPVKPDDKKSGEKSGLGALIGGVAAASKTEESAAVTSVPAKKFSYGDSNLSLLFLPAQVERMKDSIRAFESVSQEAKPTFAAPEPVVQVAEKVTEPKDYPVFYLSSIAYDTPGEWSLWVSGHKITSHKNKTDLKVVSVSRDSATFVWIPSYLTAINRRRDSKQFAATDEVKNKLAVTQAIRQEEDNGAITFTLRQNQTFAVGYFSIFEGYIDTPKMPALLETMPNTLQQQPERLDGPPTNMNQATPAPAGMPPKAVPPAGASPSSNLPPQPALPSAPTALPQPPSPNVMPPQPAMN